MFRILLFSIVLSFMSIAVSAQYVKNDCTKQIADETLRFISAKKLEFKGSKVEYLSSETEQTYLLSLGESSIKLAKNQKRITAVLNYKDRENRSNIYLIEAENTGTNLNYHLKRDNRTLQTVITKIPDIPSPTKSCHEINKQNEEALAKLQEDANSSCETKHICLPLCLDGKVAGLALYQVKPSRFACLTRYVSPWLNITKSQMLATSFDKVLEQNLFVLDNLPNK